jgi:hypothetical protein
VTDTALQAAYEGIANRLRDPGEVWGTRVRVSAAKSGTAYPYVIQFWSGGGETMLNGSQNAELRIGVKCVSDKLADAARGAGRISARLRDKGKQDSPADYLIGSSDWDILTITEEEIIYLVEGTPDTVTVYHWGAFYRLFMQAT